MPTLDDETDMAEIERLCTRVPEMSE